MIIHNFKLREGSFEALVTNLQSAVESCTTILCSRGSCSPNSASTARGSRMVRARYARDLYQAGAMPSSEEG